MPQTTNYPQKVQFILEVLDDMKSQDVDIYQVVAKTILADYFIICSGSSSTHTRAIADEVHLRCKSQGWMLGRMEGSDNPSWKILDYGDVVLHVFLPDTRSYYKLEEIWGEGKDPGPEGPTETVFEKLAARARTRRPKAGATAELKKRRSAKA
jgi:ribosome-associated protein